MALTIYRDTDSGAPTLPYGSGNLIKVLDACLRTGYGSKAGAGWTKPYVSGTTIAAFKQGSGGNGRFVRIWDARTADDPSSYGLTANVRGYENMTAISTGTGPFPTTAQESGNGLKLPLSFNGHPNPSKWVVRANSSWFDIRISTGFLAERAPGVITYDTYFAFGSFFSLKSGDIYNDFILAQAQAEYWPSYQINTGNYCYVSRSDTAVIGSQPARFLSTGRLPEGFFGLGYPTDYPYPNRVNNTVALQQYILRCDGYDRGVLPGVWTANQGLTALGWGNTFGGQGSLAGRSFEICPIGFSSGSGIIFEMSDTFTGI